MKKLSIGLLTVALSASFVGCAHNPTSAPSSFASAPINKPDTVKNYMQSIALYQQGKDMSIETERKIQRLTDNYIKTKMIVDEAVQRGNTQVSN
ncbi:hypothetical protein R4576_18420 [Acinetobacter baumannii]|nr:hypothetical protein [Acinetobacter baumannii]